MSKEVLELAKILWDYHHLNQPIIPSDIIIVFWTNEIRVVDRAIELLNSWYWKKILFSWWISKFTDKNVFSWWETESEFFAKMAIDKWINKNKIIIENKSTNTWENIIFSYEIIKNMNINNMIIVQSPIMERRVFATFMKQRPNKNIKCVVTSPNISFENYTINERKKNMMISAMV